MHITKPVEFLYLWLMFAWQRSAPPENHAGELDGVSVRNTQKLRMSFILQKIAAGNARHVDNVFGTLARYCRREDGESYISKNSAWMIEPCDLWNGWFLEGCTSMAQKEAILQYLTKLGLTQSLADCAVDFVHGRSLEKYFPTEEEATKELQKIAPEED